MPGLGNQGAGAARGSPVSGTGKEKPAQQNTGRRLASRAALGQTKSIERRHTESTGQYLYFIMAENIGVATMARPAPKPFDPKQIKPKSEYAKEALKDAKNAAETGRGRSNREEDLGDSTGTARHTITKTVPGKKGP